MYGALLRGTSPAARERIARLSQADNATAHSTGRDELRPCITHLEDPGVLPAGTRRALNPSVAAASRNAGSPYLVSLDFHNFRKGAKLMTNTNDNSGSSGGSKGRLSGVAKEGADMLGRVFNVAAREEI